ncbi:MAG: YidE/YbjL duplication [Clostridia bacterium]|nr:YidE/YbjL duplication [Clostridia bacterium]
MDYLGITLGALLSSLFVIFVILALGYLLGAITIKGVSLGSAGVLLAAIIVGVVFFLCGEKDENNKLIEFAFTIGAENPTKITLWGSSAKSVFKTVQDIGTMLFVTSVGLIAGPKFFRSFNKSMMAYVAMGAVIVLVGVGITVLISWLDPNMSMAMGTGLLSGSLTSTPAFGAAQEAAGDLSTQVTAGYGIGYLYGVLGVVLFVQLMPKILKVDIAKERETFVAANTIQIPEDGKKRFQVEEFGFFPFFITVVLGLLIGSIQIPLGSGKPFSFGSSGGTLIAGLIVGHFGHFGKLDMKVSKQTLNMMRELGLVLFLVGAGVPGGINFVAEFDWIYIVYGIIMATVPMILGFILGKFVFKLSIFNNLGSITGGMTSTPALGALISTAGTDDVSSAYAATYPFALVLIVVACKLIVGLPF